MRKITEQSVRAFLHGERFHKQNMAVEPHNGPNLDQAQMFLHGNLIAQTRTVTGGFGVEDSRQIELRDAGWQTVTTKERLNGLLDSFAPGCRIYQKNHIWYLSTARGDIEWQGSAVFSRDGRYLCFGAMARAFE